MKTLSPQEAIAKLESGYSRFKNNCPQEKNRDSLLDKAKQGQSPFAVILSCIDSRVPVEEIFDASIGDLFVARIAGNTVNEDVLGSLEYACKYALTPAIVVVGHSQCGAIKGAIAGIEDGNLTPLLKKFDQPVAAMKAENGDADRCARLNVLHVIDRIRDESKILRSLEEAGSIVIQGGFYDVSAGSLTFF
jgi:carbonic anhydrase